MKQKKRNRGKLSTPKSVLRLLDPYLASCGEYQVGLRGALIQEFLKNPEHVHLPIEGIGVSGLNVPLGALNLIHDHAV
jgi:hypothetical protein